MEKEENLESSYQYQEPDKSLQIETPEENSNDEDDQSKDKRVDTMLREEFSLDSLYRKREVDEMRTTAATNLALGFIPTFFDVYSDFRLFFDYHFGTTYKKTVDTINHEYVNSTGCTLEYKTTGESWNGTDWMEKQVSFNYSCFEVDPVFAWFTLAFIFFPGLSLWMAVLHGWNKYSTKMRVIATICGPLIIASFPVVVVLCKLISIFHNGKQFKKVCVKLGSIEGNFEAAMQLCLQVFVIFTRGDRAPSYFQWVAIATSAVSLNLPMIELFTKDKPSKPGIVGKILNICQFLPLFLSTALFRIISIALVCVFLRYYAIFYYVAVGYGIDIGSYCTGRRYLVQGGGFDAITIQNKNIENIKEGHFFFFPLKGVTYTEEEKQTCQQFNKQFHILFWFILNTIALLCIVILCNTVHVEFSVFGVKHMWSSLPIVANIILLNYIIGFTISCGVLSLVLFYLQD